MPRIGVILLNVNLWQNETFTCAFFTTSILSDFVFFKDAHPNKAGSNMYLKTIFILRKKQFNFSLLQFYTILYELYTIIGGSRGRALCTPPILSFSHATGNPGSATDYLPYFLTPAALCATILLISYRKSNFPM